MSRSAVPSAICPQTVQIRPSLSFSHRLARNDDRPALESLVDASIRALLKPHLSAAQVVASREIMGLDTRLIDDGTFASATVTGPATPGPPV